MGDDMKNIFYLSLTATQLTTLKTALTNFIVIDGGDYINEETADIIYAVVNQIDSVMEKPNLSALLGDTRTDFENLTQDELKDTYAKLLSIGKKNDLTAHENMCLHYLVAKASDLLPNQIENENEPEMEQGAEQ